VRDRRIAYADAVARGLFRPLGQGGAGIADVLRALKASRYAGWGVLEQDIALREAPTDANDPAKDVARSRDFANARG
jgi:inosose dehydratase